MYRKYFHSPTHWKSGKFKSKVHTQQSSEHKFLHMPFRQNFESRSSRRCGWHVIVCPFAAVDLWAILAGGRQAEWYCLFYSSDINESFWSAGNKLFRYQHICCSPAFLNWLLCLYVCMCVCACGNCICWALALRPVMQICNQKLSAMIAYLTFPSTLQFHTRQLLSVQTSLMLWQIWICYLRYLRYVLFILTANCILFMLDIWIWKQLKFIYSVCCVVLK